MRKVDYLGIQDERAFERTLSSLAPQLAGQETTLWNDFPKVLPGNE